MVYLKFDLYFESKILCRLAILKMMILNVYQAQKMLSSLKRLTYVIRNKHFIFDKIKNKISIKERQKDRRKLRSNW